MKVQLGQFCKGEGKDPVSGSCYWCKGTGRESRIIADLQGSLNTEMTKPRPARSTLGRLAREAVILTLLGPVAIFIGFCVMQVYYAPKAAPPGIPLAALPRSVARQWSAFRFDQDKRELLAGSDIYVEQSPGHWFRYLNGANTPSAELDRTINHTPLSAYVHFQDAALAAVVFGWPLGLGVWICYRVVRFAIQG